MAGYRIDPFHEYGHARSPRTPGEASSIASDLSALAPWLMRREHLTLASQDQSLGEARRRDLGLMASLEKLPANLGACNVLFVATVESRSPGSPLRKAFFLPLCWRQDTADHPGLPRALTGLASTVRHAFEKKFKKSWGLHFNPECGLDTIDLSRMEVTAESGWASLATGLLLANWGVFPKANLAMSGAWREGWGLVEVGSLAEKMTAARDFGCRRFFTSTDPESLREVDVPMGLTVGHLFPATEPMDVLAPVLREFAVEPTIETGAPLQVRLAYANNMFGASREDRARREAYALANLTRELADRLRNATPEAQELGNTDNLVLNLSSQSAQLLTTLIARPTRTLVFHTNSDRFARSFEAFRDSCPAEIRRGLKPVPLPEIKGESKLVSTAYEKIQRETIAFLRDAPEGSISAADITGGNKGMTSAVTLAACASGAKVFHVDSTWGGYNHAFGTEKIRFVREIDP